VFGTSLAPPGRVAVSTWPATLVAFACGCPATQVAGPSVHPSLQLAVLGAFPMVNHRQDSSGPADWSERLLLRFGNWLFATEDDAVAKARGWQIDRSRGKRVRRYRDPRWDTVHACTTCDGRGARLLDALACQDCDGVGVVRSAPVAAADLGGAGGRP
jgi:hypothetical protein